jgi:small subunit ribosomal protein S24e
LKLEIVSKNENKLMDRFEVKFTSEHSGEVSPNRDSVRTALAGAMGVQKERIVVSEMGSEYGTGASAGYAKVYSSTESAKKHEKNYGLGRHGMAEKKPKRVKRVAAPKKKQAK